MIEQKTEIRLLQNYEASWLAAAIDGEGSIGKYNYGKEGRRVIVTVNNTNEQFIDRVKEYVGCGSKVKYAKFNESHKGTKPIYTYSLKGCARCYWLLNQLLPYLIIKKEKVIAIIQELENNPIGRDIGKTEEARNKASIATKLSWQNPIIRKKRIVAMKKSRLKDHD